MRTMLLWVLAALPIHVHAQTAPAWEAAQTAIVADYAKQQPADKVLEVNGPDKRDAILIAVRYWATALVERADKSRSRDKVWVEYRLVGDRWELHTVRVYESTALSDVNAPAKALAQSLIAAAWQAAKCDGFDIRNLSIEGEPRFQLETVADRAAAKRWYVYQIQVDAIGTGKFRLSKEGTPYMNRTQNMLLWNAAEQSWSVEQRHVRCTGFSEKK
jgi:hypothetical protein